MSNMTITVSGVRVDVTFEAFKGYPDTREEPGEPAHVEIESIKIDGNEIADIVTEDFKEQVEITLIECLNELEQDYSEPEYEDY